MTYKLQFTTGIVKKIFNFEQIIQIFDAFVYS